MRNSKKRPRNDAARRRALADATAGVIGSLASVLAFYPVDVWKTSLQAGVAVASSSSSSSKSKDDDIIGDDDTKTALTTTTSTTEGATRIKLSRLFRGLPHKIVHTIVSSFTYFFVYSLVQTKYADYRREVRSLHHHPSSGKNNANGKLQTNATSTLTKLLLTAFAAVINTGITLPLDTISSRKQVGSSSAAASSSSGDESDESKDGLVSNGTQEMNGISNNENDNNSISGENDDGSGSEEYHSANNQQQQQQQQQLYIKTPEKYKFSFSTNLAQEAFATSTIDTTDNLQDSQTKQKNQLKSILSLWNGLFPSILLCTNPAIQYTMFDTLKSALLQGGEEEGALPSHRSDRKLSMWEAFLFGLVSKFFATVVTYPLIRCKVLLMVSSPEAFREEESNDDDNNNNNPARSGKSKSAKDKRESNETKSNTQHATTQQQYDRNSPHPPPKTNINDNNNAKYPRSLPLLLVHIFRKDGMRGLYKGCSLQLLHTVLKSAMLMMVREKITFASHGFFRVGEGADE